MSGSFISTHDKFLRRGGRMTSRILLCENLEAFYAKNNNKKRFIGGIHFSKIFSMVAIQNSLEIKCVQHSTTEDAHRLRT